MLETYRDRICEDITNAGTLLGWKFMDADRPLAVNSLSIVEIRGAQRCVVVGATWQKLQKFPKIRIQLEKTLKKNIHLDTQSKPTVTMRS